ncbi:MAG TPA: hypothetical protein VM123_18880 [archaeon]|nr:hypothetical protein [archaeon]
MNQYSQCLFRGFEGTEAGSGFTVRGRIIPGNALGIVSPQVGGKSDALTLLTALQADKLQYLQAEYPHQQKKNSDHYQSFPVIVWNRGEKIPDYQKKACAKT